MHRCYKFGARGNLKDRVKRYGFFSRGAAGSRGMFDETFACLVDRNEDKAWDTGGGV